MAKKSASERIVTPKGRASFMSVLKPVENMNGEMEYTLDLMVPKTAAKQLALMKARYQKVCKSVWGTDALKNRPFLYSDKTNAREPKPIWKDGDARYKAADKDKRSTYEAYKGTLYTKIGIPASKGKPTVVDKDGAPIIDGSEIQSGDYVRCFIDISGYDSKKWGPMISIKLLGVQKIETGEPLGGGSVSEEEVEAAFADASDEDFDYGAGADDVEEAEDFDI